MTLTRDWECHGLLKWSPFNKPDYMLAQCNQTSCRSEEGFTISHAQYLKGKPYLTITAADYSNRGTYTCQCKDSEVCDVRLIIQPVEMRRVVIPGEPIDVHLPLTDQVEVSFTPSAAVQPSNLQICTVTKEKIHCSPDYKERASFLNTLQIKNGCGSDSGNYTVRDQVNDETLTIIQVHVTEPCPVQEGGVPAWAVVLIVLLLLFGAAFVSLSVIHLRLRREHQQCRQGSEGRRHEQIPMTGTVPPDPGEEQD
ncbi:uncharacterized protein LOC128509411 [Clarias gariepinus]|uniref:uncharacterized protein LOC128509411 n=1 Tax=Clarias gariepinus TaxID=13013 RepID=UPI00234CB606|nr:uncharacterized protein LOC128509411 [Clarias gariepinus]